MRGGKREGEGAKGVRHVPGIFKNFTQHVYTCTHTHTPSSTHSHTHRERLARDSWQQSSLNALHERSHAPPILPPFAPLLLPMALPLLSPFFRM